MSTFRRPGRAKRNTRGASKDSLPLVLDAVPSTVDFSTPFVTCTYPTPVVLKGLPRWFTNTSLYPTSAVLLAPNVVKCGYNTPGSVTSIVVPLRDPAVRTNTGGYARAGSFPAS